MFETILHHQYHHHHHQQHYHHHHPHHDCTDSQEGSPTWTLRIMWHWTEHVFQFWQVVSFRAVGTNSVDLILNFVELHFGIISLKSSSSLLSSSTSSLSSSLTSSSSSSSSPTKHHRCDLHVFPRQIQLIYVDRQTYGFHNCHSDLLRLWTN